jgi:hypothetical protein
MSTGGGADVVFEAQEERLRAATARARVKRTAFMLDT